MDAVDLVNLTKTYRNSVTAVDRLSLSLKKGTMLGFLGPNGAGKTTAIKVMTGMMAPTSGSVSIDGIDIHICPKDALSHVGAGGGDTLFMSSCRRRVKYVSSA